MGIKIDQSKYFFLRIMVTIMQIHFTKTHSTVNTHKRIKLDALHLKNIYLYAHIFLSMRVVCVCVSVHKEYLVHSHLSWIMPHKY